MNPEKFPAWGVLARLPEHRMREILAPLRERYEPSNLIYRSAAEWTALFNMQPSDTTDDEAAERLRRDGVVPVYRFDFSRFEYFTWRWDGSSWVHDRDPLRVLREVGIECPGWDEREPELPPDIAAVSRDAVVIEGVRAEAARRLVPELGVHVVDGDRGAIAYDVSDEARFACEDRAPGHVFEFRWYPKSREFRFRVMKGENAVATFRGGENWIVDGTPVLADVEGETEPSKIIAKFGIAPEFLE